jgi:hypothetical protein
MIFFTALCIEGIKAWLKCQSRLSNSSFEVLVLNERLGQAYAQNIELFTFPSNTLFGTQTQKR